MTDTRPILLAAAVLFGASAASADSAKMAFSYQAQPPGKAPRRTQIIFQVEGFYHNGESGLMGTDEVIPGFPKTYFEEVIPIGGIGRPHRGASSGSVYKESPRLGARAAIPCRMAASPL